MDFTDEQLKKVTISYQLPKWLHERLKEDGEMRGMGVNPLLCYIATEYYIEQDRKAKKTEEDSAPCEADKKDETDKKD